MFRSLSRTNSRRNRKPVNGRFRHRLWLQALEERTVPASLIVTDAGDVGPNTLRGMIATANGNAQADTITFDPSVTAINLSTGQIAITEASQGLFIDGGGTVTITNTQAQGATSRIFNITSTGKPAIGFKGLTLSGGNLSAANNGGAIQFTDQSVTLTNCTVSGNKTLAAGGAMATSTASANLTISNSTITNNSAATTGGAINVGGTATVTISGSTLSNNRGTVGGAINAAAAMTLTTSSATLSGNTATTGAGGAINVTGGAATIGASTISSNFATTTGGGINAATTVTWNLTINGSSSFTTNSATGTGGAINTAGAATININPATFSGNQGSAGGAINAGAASSVTVTSGSFNNNTSTGTGGAITLVGASTASLTSSTLSNNVAATTGGAMHASSSITLTLSKSTISNNVAQQGGGLRFTNATSTVTLTTSAVSGNTATAGNGGGLYFAATGSKLTITDSAVSKNLALLGGGGVGGLLGAVTITNSTLAQNKAYGSATIAGGGGGGAMRISASSVTINNSTIANNVAQFFSGGGIFFVTAPSTINFNSTIVSDNFAFGNRDIGSAAALFNIGGNNNIIGAVDPAVVNFTGTKQSGTEAAPFLSKTVALASNGGPTQTMALAYSSPAINMGNNVNAPTISFDQRGTPFGRPVTLAQTDVGAFENQGSGDSSVPFVDAISALANITSTGGTTYGFSVTYDDETGLNTASFGTGEIQVAVMDGSLTITPSMTGTVSGGGNKIVASYQFTAPGGTWDKSDYGLYEVRLVANKLFDIDAIPNSGLAQTAGSFQVSLFSALNVDNKFDAFDGNFQPGNVSLREAVLIANTFVGVDTVTFDPSLNSSTITLTLGEIPVTEELVVNGPGDGLLAVSGQPTPSIINRAFNVNIAGGTSTFTLTGLTLTGFNLRSGGGNGGVIAVDDDELIIDDMTFTKNAASVAGGAIALNKVRTTAGESLHATNTIFNENSSVANTGGTICPAVAGLTIFFDSCTFTNNSTGGNGGVIGTVGNATVTISNSVFTGNSGAQGGVLQGASNIQLTISDSTFTNNSGNNGGALNVGGGAFTITKSVFSNNTAKITNGGAIAFQQAAVYTINDCIFTGNTAVTDGGAILANGAGTISLNRSILSGNTANNTGGAIYQKTANITILDSAINSNISLSPTAGGGGISVGTGALTINNSTLSSNSAGATGVGGGIRGGISASTVPLTITTNNSTIAKNVAGGGGGGIGLLYNNVTLNFTSTILAQNSHATDPDLYSTTTSPTVTVNLDHGLIGAVTDTDLSVSPLSSVTGTLGSPVDPLLSPLDNFGGPAAMKLHGLLKGSPAHDTGINNLGYTHDQRGDDTLFPRTDTVSFLTDMGAFEGELEIPTATATSLPATVTAPVPPATTYTVQIVYFDSKGIDTATIDVNDLNVTGKGYVSAKSPDTVTFTGGGGSVTATYTFTNPPAGWTSAGDGVYSVNMVASQVFNTQAVPFSVLPGSLGTFIVAIPTSYVVDNTGDVDDGNYTAGQQTLREAIKRANLDTTIAEDTITFDSIVFAGAQTISLTGGQLAINDPVVIVGTGSANLTIKGAVAAAANNRIFIINATSGTTNVKVSGMTLTGGNLTSGNNGGALINNAGTLLVTDCVFTGNKTAQSGGAVSVVSGTSPTFMNCFFGSNTSTISGGAVVSQGAAPVFDNCTFTLNTANSLGGAIAALVAAKVTITNSTFTSNTAVAAGGVMNTVGNSTINVTGSSFSNNLASGEGGVFNCASPITITVNTSTFTSNTTSVATGGGGVMNLGNASGTFSSSTFTLNAATGASGVAGAIKMSSGGIFALNRVVFSQNSATLSGGALSIINAGDTVTLDQCTLSGNTSGTTGGGVYVTGANVTILNSTLSGNVASGAATGGGGVGVTTGTLTITNSTLSGNTADGATGVGGGLFASGAANLTINNSTLTQNVATAGGGGLGFTNNTAIVTVSSTIIAQNVHSSQPDVFSTVATALTINISDSIVGAVTDADITLSGTNQTGTLATPINALLGPLANNGGPTQTHGLYIQSPAIDMGSNGLSLSYDQRGGDDTGPLTDYPRVLNGIADVGAFEGTLPIPGAKVILPNVVTSGGTSYVVTVVYLDETAIDTSKIDVNDITLSGPFAFGPVSPDTFGFTGSGTSVTATYTFTPPVNGAAGWDYTDNGVYTVTMNANQVFDTDGPNAVLPGTLGTFAVAISHTFVVDKVGDADDSIYTAGELTIREAVFLANKYVTGSIGAPDTISFDTTVFNAVSTITLTTGEMAITDPVYVDGPVAGLTVSGSATASATNRIFNVNIPSSPVTVTFNRMTLTGGNITGGSSGSAILAVDETMVLTNMVFTGNKGANGGAVAFSRGVLTISKSTFTNNTAGTNGGALTNTLTGGTTISIDSSTFTDNRANAFGGVIFTTGTSSVSIANSTFSRNSSNNDGGVLHGASGIVLDVESSTFIDNSTLSANSSVSGGGALHLGTATVTIDKSVFRGNSAYRNGGAINVNSGASTVNLGNITITNTVFDHNHGGDGGAIRFNTPGTLTVDQSLFTNNIGSTGGAIALPSATIIGTLTVTNSTLSGNTATASLEGGGAIALYASNGAITNTTISGNVALANGGGIWIGQPTWFGTLAVYNSTLTNNSVPAGVGGGLFVASKDGAVTFNSTILAGNSSGNTAGVFLAASSDVYFALGDSLEGDNNIVGAIDTSNTILTGSGNQTGTEASPQSAGLYPLLDNGGFALPGGYKIKTHALKVGSAALNMGNNVLSLTSDERHDDTLYPRVIGGTADVGAYEGVSSLPFATVTLPNVPPAGADYVATVVYEDETGIDTTSIDIGDVQLQLTYPSTGTPFSPASVVISGSGTKITAAYHFTPPVNGAAGWDITDNGKYTLTLVGDVKDTDVPQHSVNKGTLGSFTVGFTKTFTVDNTSDADDGNYGSLQLTLREAIKLANASVGSADTIGFDTSVFGGATTITLALGQFTISDSVTINGPGSGLLAIDAAGSSRHFTVDDPADAPYLNVTMSGMRLINGAVTGNGGAIEIDNDTVTLSNMEISGNKASLDGGGVSVLGHLAKLTIQDSKIANNTATGAASGVNGYGGGVNLRSTASVTVLRSTISGNTANGDGGGLYFFDGGSLVMDSSTVSGNTGNATFGGTGGGGIYFFGAVQSGGFTITNSTISGNKSTLSGGGGIAFSRLVGSALIRNSTITANDAASSTTAPLNGGGINWTGDTTFGKLTLQSTIVAGNTVAGKNDPKSDINANAAISVAGDNNLIGIMDGSNSVTLTGTGNLVGDATTPLNAKLGALGNNGGPTQTHALLAGSPALDAGNNISPAQSFDQRGSGFVRTGGSQTDIGAYEFQVAPPPSVTAVQFGDGTVQRSMVRQVVITFNTPVTFTGAVADAFTLFRHGTGGVTGNVTLSATQSGGGSVVTLDTFTGGLATNGSLNDGYWDITIDASKINGTGGSLDGVDDEIVGGNYFVTGTSSKTSATPNNHFRLYGDGDGDAVVNQTDFIAFRNAFNGGPSGTWDYGEGDNNVTQADFIQFRNRFNLNP